MKTKYATYGLTAERVRELFNYDPETGLLTWRVARNRCVVGSAAGNKRRDGYFRVGVDLHIFYTHRIAWAHIHGVWPAGGIDHINGDPSDNRAVNLRDVSQQVNMQNLRKAQKSNRTTGLLGTHFYRKGQVFRAQITDPVTRKPKHIGSFATAEEAHDAYIKAKRILHEGNTL